MDQKLYEQGIAQIALMHAHLQHSQPKHNLLKYFNPQKKILDFKGIYKELNTNKNKSRAMAYYLIALTEIAEERTSGVLGAPSLLERI